MNSLIARLIGYLIAIATAAMTYWVFHAVASFFGAVDPHFIAFTLLVAMVVHETCHLIVIEANGIPTMMFFLVVIGGASPLWGHTSKFKELAWERRAGIALAGVVGNFIVILATFFFVQNGSITYNEFLRMANLNGSLILWNLFPLPIWDGGRFTKLLFDSVSEDRDTKYMFVLATAFFVTLIILLLFFGKLTFIHFWLFSLGLHWQATHDKPYGSENPKSIPRSHQKWWAIVFLVMISIGAVILSVTPNWI